ncbi:hypothetical protein [Fictibacillus sp. BK138]|uniref:hypothetical protein n=1 Tax=Fictibacillus sp. BK138 TaxID=2512121 RepID=UPI001029C37B|nr:hypothetical protein [Fictibacillus sp. BK138]RZT21580.1 hypothetical protein EV282_0642 [Fictibacillus sp. BK138]
MTHFVILIIFTMIISSIFYFYPPNIPLKFKMILIGLSFFLALCGLFLVNNLSVWNILGVIVGAAFISSYFAEKQMNLAGISTGPTEFFLPISEDKPEEVSVDNISDETRESAATLDVPPEDVQIEPIEDIQDLHMEEKIESKVKDKTEVEEIQAVSDELEELSQLEIESIIPTEEVAENEFSFLLESREIMADEFIDKPVLTDINEEVINQRSQFLDEMDQLEDTLTEPEEELITIEEADSIDLLEIEELMDPEEQIFEEKQHEIEETSDMQEVLAMDDQFDELVSIESEITMIGEMDEREVPPEIRETFEEVETLVDVNCETEEVIFTKDMDYDVQDMLLNTLSFYQEQGDEESYQVMLHSIISQPLSDRDFYLFSKLLLDSYVKVDDSAHMKEILTAMSEKLRGYSVIAEETERYFDALPVGV